MAVYNYQARTKTGELRTGTVEAPSREAAINLLLKNDLFIVSVESAALLPIFSRKIKFLERVKSKEIVVFSRQLASLMEARVPLLESLNSLLKQSSNRLLKETILKISEDVEGGTNLSQALAKHPKVFSNFYINMVRAGEVSGNLEKSLSHLADHLEKEYYLISEIKGALSYPVFILSVFIAAGIVVMTVVIPQLTGVLLEAGQDIPFSTKIIIAMSEFLKGYWWSIPIILGVALVLFFRAKKTKKGSRFIDKLILKLPVFGKLLKQTYLTRFADNLSTLIKGGLPITKALKITADVVGNTVYKDLFYQVAKEVRGGASISSVLSRSKEIPPMVTQMVSVGEKTGQLDKILKNISSFYSKEVERIVANLSRLIEPFLILILGGAVAVLVASVLLPIYNLAGGL